MLHNHYFLVKDTQALGNKWSPRVSPSRAPVLSCVHLFPSACYAGYVNYNLFIYTEHLRVHKNSLKRVRAFQIELEFESVGF